MNLELAHRIAAEGEYMPSQAEWKDLCDLERAGFVKEAGFFGGGAITYWLTEKGPQWLAYEALGGIDDHRGWREHGVASLAD